MRYAIEDMDPEVRDTMEFLIEENDMLRAENRKLENVLMKLWAKVRPLLPETNRHG